MGNSREFTSKYVANKEAFERILKANKCTSLTKKKAAFERGVALPNRLPPISRARQSDSQEGREL